MKDIDRILSFMALIANIAAWTFVVGFVLKRFENEIIFLIAKI